MNWKRIRVLVTGGASFIGSTLVDALLARSAEVRVVDNLTSGKKENLADHLSHGAIEFREANLLDDGVARSAGGAVGSRHIALLETRVQCVAASASRGRHSASGWVGMSRKVKLVSVHEAVAPIVLRR